MGRTRRLPQNMVTISRVLSRFPKENERVSIAWTEAARRETFFATHFSFNSCPLRILHISTGAALGSSFNYNINGRSRQNLGVEHTFSHWLTKPFTPLRQFLPSLVFLGIFRTSPCLKSARGDNVKMITCNVHRVMVMASDVKHQHYRTVVASRKTCAIL
jgi:hypothetical protein